jgi:hypothetical protein
MIMDHKDFILLTTLIMLLIELLQETRVATNPISFSFFQIDFTKCPQGLVLQSKYILLFNAFQKHKIMCVVKKNSS